MGGFSKGHTSGRSRTGTQLCWIPKAILLIPGQWVSKEGPQISGVGLTWELVRHANPRPHLPLILKLLGLLLISPQVILMLLNVENHSPGL